jgi:hypothetical protein
MIQLYISSVSKILRISSKEHTIRIVIFFIVILEKFSVKLYDIMINYSQI